MAQAGGYHSPAVQEKACGGEASRLHSLPDCYKIKLRSSGYRLVYQVIDQEVVVFVVAVDRLEREQVYRKAAERLK
ncbi:hypothetical protein D9M68_1000840 [compost metagenome]